MSTIVEFLEGAGRDAQGRSLGEVMAFGLGAIESHHDFIQWIFPLEDRSRALPDSPTLAPDDVEAIKGSRKAQANLLAATQRMAWFYDSTDHWLKADDHNHLRITRIIKSLRLLVGDAHADQFRARILAKSHRLQIEIPETTRSYWDAA